MDDEQQSRLHGEDSRLLDMRIGTVTGLAEWMREVVMYATGMLNFVVDQGQWIVDLGK